MVEQDLYQVLGVDRGASDAEIKKAYRRLAMELHPDRNQGDEQIAERFKVVNAAYDVLKDSRKRAAYDRFGHAAFNGGMGGGRGPHAGADFGASFADMFEELFGGGAPGTRGGRTGQSNQGRDLEYELAIELENAYTGHKAKIRIPAPSACDRCDSTGSASKSAPGVCGNCGGSGVLRTSQGFMTFQRTCSTCGGAGQAVTDPCRQCRGSGRVQRTRELDVSIPAGIEDGNNLRVRGEGEAGIRGGPAGDLFIQVRIRRNKQFHRNGADLHSRMVVPFTTAALGGDARAPTLDGNWAKVEVPAGTQTGRQLRLRGKGMPRLNSSTYGDLYLDVFVEIPSRLNRRQRELLEEFAKLERRSGRSAN